MQYQFIINIITFFFVVLNVLMEQGFLKKEFSHENIYFWAACERFHLLFPTDDKETASSEAQKIFERHLGTSASEPVNVDSQARQTAQDNLSHPGPELFDQVNSIDQLFRSAVPSQSSWKQFYFLLKWC